MSELKKSKLIERLSHFLLRGPEDREQLFELLKSSYEKNLMDADSLSMIEGVLQVSEMQVRDILKNSCRKTGGYVYNADGWSSELGYGVIDMFAAVGLVWGRKRQKRLKG